MSDGSPAEPAPTPAVPPWTEVATPVAPAPPPKRVAWWPGVLEKVLASVVVLGLVTIVGAVAARAMADNDAIDDAIAVSDLLTRSALQPTLSDDLLSPTPAAAAAALARLDTVVRAVLGGTTLIRVKLWAVDGRVVYSDEQRLIGQQFPLDEDERRAMRGTRPIGEVSDLSQPENEFEREAGQLLEVYRPVRTPSGVPLLFETYTRYSHVGDRSERILLGFAATTLSGLALMHLLYLPASWGMARRLRRLQRRLDLLLTNAQSASDEERRRIAGALHDGVVQDLAATSYVVAGSAEHARGSGQTQLAARLDTAAAGVRASIGALRSLLVDIYPPNLRVAGLAAALEDLANAVRIRGITVNVRADGDLELDPATQLLLYRITQECLRNAERHARANRVLVRVRHSHGLLRLEVSDDGVGFDPGRTLACPEPGHLGVQVMRDLAAAQCARLDVRSAAGAGTRWRLEVMTGAAG
jgi:signal transduction histidine kinase